MSVQTLAQQQRAEIIRRDVALANRISREYSGMWQALAHDLLKLLRDMQAAEDAANAAGLPFDATLWIHQIRRLDTLLASVQDGMRDFTNTARQYVESWLPDAWQMGEDNAIKLMEASLGERIGIEFGRPSLRAFDILAGRGASNEAIAKLLMRLPLDAREMVRKRLLAGLALGQGPREIARSIQQGLGMPLNRALVVARTESINAYRSAALDTYRANSDVVEKWIWSAATGCCAFCASMDGTEHDLGENMNSHPCCRCAPIPKPVSYKIILARAA